MSQRRLLLWLRLLTGAAFMYQGVVHIQGMREQAEHRDCATGAAGPAERRGARPRQTRPGGSRPRGYLLAKLPLEVVERGCELGVSALGECAGIQLDRQVGLQADAFDLLALTRSSSVDCNR